MDDQERRELVELDLETCRARLAAAAVSRVAFRTGDELLILPVTHIVVDGDVCFQSAPGTKLGSAAGGDEVLVEVDDYDVDARTGWSVIARGRAHLVTDHGELETLMGFAFRPWADLGREVEWVRVEVDQLTGREVAPRRTD